MAWRDTFLRYFGPGLLGGITAGDWVKRLRDNHFAVAPSCLNRVMAITLHSLQNSVYRRFEQWRYGPKLKDVVVQSPLFLLGHWRHGTTHLHNLMTVDERFAFANNYQALFPHSFLSTEASASRLMGFFMPKRRPMDNVEWNLQSPQEDEFALYRQRQIAVHGLGVPPTAGTLRQIPYFPGRLQGGSGVLARGIAVVHEETDVEIWTSPGAEVSPAHL